MHNFLKNITDGILPALTQNVSTAVQAAIDGATTLLQPGAGVIRFDGIPSQNPNSFGFAFEHLHAIGYNINASLAGSDNRAWQIPADGSSHAPDIYVTDLVGQVIATIQAKVGNPDYVDKQIARGVYEKQKIVTNSENHGIKDADVVISVDGIRSIPINRATAEWVAHNPYLAANLIQAAAIGGEIIAGGVAGAAINTTITVLLESIQLVGAYCRGEATITPERLHAFQSKAIDALSNGFLRGASVKLLQRLLGGNAFAALGFALGAEVVPALMRVIKKELTLEEAIQQVGPRALTAGIVTTVVLLIPPLGTVLFSASLLQAVWEELTPEFKQYVLKMVETVGRSVDVGVKAGQTHLGNNSWDLLGASSASAVASSAEMMSMQDELDGLLE